ncbi:MAG: hypothetical protein K2G30_10990 [Muribaculaceae bacterium]|nr:hypothetical protein [Muribaculaceae bacterium]
MKESLLISAAALCAAMNMNAEERVYDFNIVAPQFAIDAYLAEGEPDFGWGLSGNVDIVDKNGVAGPKFIENAPAIVTIDDVVDASVWFDMETGELVKIEEADLDHSFITWTDKGCSRVTLQPGWGTMEEGAVGGDYQAATEDDYVATKCALTFLRMGQGKTGCRNNTFFQMPAFQGPFTMDVYIGNTAGTYGSQLEAKVITLSDGVESEPTVLSVPTFEAKKMYKTTYNYEGSDAPVIRVGCNGFELGIYHIVLKSADGAGVENVAVEAAAENAPIYNTLGIQVDENYKGLVIKGGKKYIQK